MPIEDPVSKVSRIEVLAVLKANSQTMVPRISDHLS